MKPHFSPEPRPTQVVPRVSLSEIDCWKGTLSLSDLSKQKFDFQRIINGIKIK